jgi:demethylmenaquinone methyltransferase/2-methoxy-6-polyprenyl-1,4-benzoquinol methylase
MNNENETDTTDFGFTRVPVAEKAHRVAGVFDSVAERYDVMNDLMSFGLHRLWKRFTLSQTRLKRGQRALDIAGGTGDITRGLIRQVGPEGRVVLADINAAMLARGRARLVDAGVGANLVCVQADAEQLPFAAASFDCITIGFGLRNVTHKERALASLYNCLKPSGQLLVLEFSEPRASGLKPLYDAYSFNVLPLLGQLVTKDADSYRYLAESIRMHPNQDTLKSMLNAAGFERTEYFNLAGGIVALHRGYKL